ncbi:MAG TPA: efflux RND transporter permease subunit [Caulobacteraceae bacterium]|nr:efflux RND transporter permease subunit [Caulobacteraceae bacterium]
MLSRFFIERPIFAWVVAMVIMLAGILAILTLPVAQYPTIAPPAVTISATYPGASAEVLQTSVTQVIEQQLKGIDHLLYFSSTSTVNGQAQITVTFEPGTNPDIAQVQVQNKVQQAVPILPSVVQQQGLIVAKSQVSFLMVIALFDRSGRYTDIDLGDMVNSRIVDPISRVNGVGDNQVFGGQYALRIWLDPYKLNNFKLNVSDVRVAVLAQNVQVASGELGAPPVLPGNELDATVNSQARLQTADQFRDIILKAQPDGSLVRLRDVARVEIGGDSYAQNARFNGYPAAGMAVKLAPGANALRTASLVRARMAQLAKTLPPGVEVEFPVDNTSFVKLSIRDVITTLIIAILLVVAVMYLFLQNLRATLIPAIAVPVVLLGTFGVLAAAGYSINTLTLFAMVLAIGLLVDDAIVVVENVQRIMETEGLSPKDATIKSMGEITGALVGIATVLSAVFLPMAFFGGSTGAIYRQFSITIVSAMGLSVMVALVLSPALCATLLKPVVRGHALVQTGFFGRFNRGFDAGVTRYQAVLSGLVRRPWPAAVVYLLVVVTMVTLFVRLPTGFLPDEDQGTIINLFTLPPGAVQSRSLAVARKLEHFYLGQEGHNVSGMFDVVGFNFAGAGQNMGLAFIKLRDWKYRTATKNKAPAIVQRAMRYFSQIHEARVFAFVPPPVQELGNATGFDMELENQGAIPRDQFIAARNQLLGMASQDPILVGVRPNGQEDTPQLMVDVDQARAGALGLALSDVYDALGSYIGESYINDFIDRGRVKHVYMQADAPYRMIPEDISGLYVRGVNGVMTPFSAFASSHWLIGPARLERYNGLPSFEIQGQAAPGTASGTAMIRMEQLASKLPAGVGLEWTGTSYQERLAGNAAPSLYALSILVVFMCLAALYESWSVPFAVMLVLPLGIAGALAAATLRGFYNDVYFQVGLLTTMGLSAKNAILIVEFAYEAERDGATVVNAALEAAALRLRPILMTSLAFIAGVTPLALSNGAGAGSQNDIGTGVIGGMLSATVLAIILVPLFYIAVRGGFWRRRPAEPAAEAQT